MSLRKITDAALRIVQALPAAAANVNSSAIDLESIGPASLESVEFEIFVPALPALVEDRAVTITIQDSADGVAFSAIPEVASLVITGGVGNGAPATRRVVRLPSSTRRHVGLNVAVEASGGNNSAVSLAAQLLL